MAYGWRHCITKSTKHMVVVIFSVIVLFMDLLYQQNRSTTINTTIFYVVIIFQYKEKLIVFLFRVHGFYLLYIRIHFLFAKNLGLSCRCLLNCKFHCYNYFIGIVPAQSPACPPPYYFADIALSQVVLVGSFIMFFNA